MGAGKWIGGILGFMTMGPLGALAGFALGSLLDGNNGPFWQYIRKKDRRKPETMTKVSGIAFYSPCWLWRLTSSVQTDASCTAKWNMYANS